MTTPHHTRMQALYLAWSETDRAWVLEIEKAFPKDWPGDVRYIEKGKGEPGTPLRAAFDAMVAARDAFKQAGGDRWLMGYKEPIAC